MTISNEVIQYVYELEEREVNINDIEKIFIGYDDKNFTEIGYKEVIDYVMADIVSSDLKGGEAISYINESLSEWANELEIKISRGKVANRKKPGDLERTLILENSGVSKKKIAEISNDCKNLARYGYKEELEYMIAYISENGLKGEAAVNYIKTETDKWGISIAEWE